MVPFTDGKQEYLKGQRLGRLATADPTGTRHVVPVGFQLSENGGAIDVGGQQRHHLSTPCTSSLRIASVRSNASVDQRQAGA
jgi:hypothetical protein